MSSAYIEYLIFCAGFGFACLFVVIFGIALVEWGMKLRKKIKEWRGK